MSIKNISNQKSVLAKLLAQENITVEHRAVHTASFDPVNRILCLPTWKDMSPDVYDLLVGHEVGHAWETPAEGWHSAIEEKGLGFKSFLNVVEDARIEKLIKARYPGISAPMYRGYNELYEKDFFGVIDVPVDELPIIDRLNLHFKIGALHNIPFSIKEQLYVKKMELLKTWEDVYNLASELYSYQKEVQKEYDDINVDYKNKNSNQGNYDADDDYLDLESDSDSDQTNDASEFLEENEPYSITDKIFREKESSLISDDMKPYVYVNMPKADLNNIIISYKDLYTRTDFSNIDNYSSTIGALRISNGYALYLDDEESAFCKIKLLNEYRNRNLKFIGYLVKEFELKRNAAQYARASVSKSGEIDTEKLWSYKIKEDIFQRVTKIPNGKNHGMVMFIDWSSSMDSNITSSIEQILILSDFCRKVNIPFEVYAFSDNTYNLKNFTFLDGKKDQFSTNPKELYLRCNLFLINILSSQMSKTQYRDAQHRLLQIGKIYEGGLPHIVLNHATRSARIGALPKHLRLSGTPLNEALVAANTIIKSFKQQYKIDVLSTIVLTDGDGVAVEGFYEKGGVKSINKVYNSENLGVNLVIKDKDTNISVIAKPNEIVTNGLLRLLQANSNTKLVGYYISYRSARYSAQRISNYYGKAVTKEEIDQYIRKNRFFSIKGIGYDEYFIIDSKDLIVGEDIIDAKSTQKRDLLNAFIKNQKNKVLNRVLLNKFVEQIA